MAVVGDGLKGHWEVELEGVGGHGGSPPGVESRGSGAGGEGSGGGGAGRCSVGGG